MVLPTSHQAHCTPPPPQSNGLIKRTIQTVKDLLRKCKESGQDSHLPSQHSAQPRLAGTCRASEWQSVPAKVAGHLEALSLCGSGDISARL